MNKLRDIMGLLLAGLPLPRDLGDHPLKGDWKTRRDLHIEPDWLLIYRADDETVHFDRTGTHSDLFGKYAGKSGSRTYSASDTSG